MHSFRILLIMFSVVACAGQRPAPDPLPASMLARAALVEWEAWGRVVIEGWPDVRPANTAATPERFARLVEYWNTVPGGGRVARRLIDLRSGIAGMSERISADMPDGEDGRPVVVAGLDDVGFYSYPAWSAAFISAVARRAAVPESDLPSTYRHARYIDAVLARASVATEGAAFLPRAPEDYVPVAGDLLCADRSAVPLLHWSGRFADRGRPRPMHCDIVVRTRPGTIEAVGGNVQGLVALRRFPADASGRALPAPYGRPAFVLVLSAQGERR